MQISNADLIRRAFALAHKRVLSDSASCGSVGCALLTQKGEIYSGISVKADCGIGNCAESNTINTMLAKGESWVKKIVVVNHRGKIIPPCGRCRELLFQIDGKNLNTKIVIGKKRCVKLDKLLPLRWQEFK